jgi:hypothetical protein
MRGSSALAGRETKERKRKRYESTRGGGQRSSRQRPNVRVALNQYHQGTLYLLNLFITSLYSFPMRMNQSADFGLTPIEPRSIDRPIESDRALRRVCLDTCAIAHACFESNRKNECALRNQFQARHFRLSGLRNATRIIRFGSIAIARSGCAGGASCFFSVTLITVRIITTVTESISKTIFHGGV